MRSLVKSLATPYRLPDGWPYSPPPGVRVLDVRTLEELAVHADAWDDLLLRSGRSAPVLTYEWISAFFKYQLRPGQRWLCLFAYEGTDLIGLIPLIIGRCYSLGWYRVLLFHTPCNLYHTGGTDYLTRLGREDLLETFVDYLRQIPRAIPTIRFAPALADSSPVRFKGKERRVRILSRFAENENSVVLPDSFEAYLAAMSPNLRRYLKKNTKKLERLDGVRFRVPEQERAWEINFDELASVEDRNWKGRIRSSINARPADLRMLREIAETLSKRGRMVWNFLEADGKTIAGHYAICINRVLSLVKIGFDEDYGFCSPGNLLMSQVIRAAIESGEIDEINMRADHEWHHKWQVVPRPSYDLLVCPRTILFEAMAKLGLLGRLHRAVAG